MFFSDWYFCNTLKMSLADANNYLECLFTLEKERGPLNEKIKALDWLEKQEESLLHAYAIPKLIKGILRKNASQEYDERQWMIYLQKSKKIIINILENSEKAAIIGGCLNLLQNIEEIELKDLVDQVIALPYVEAEHIYEFDYLESDECAYVIVLLSILYEAARQDIQMVSMCIGESNTRLFNMAMEKKLGFLPWKLTMLLKCLCGTTFREAEELFPDKWIAFPECLELAALFILEREKKLEKSPEEIINVLIRESCQLDFLEKRDKQLPKDILWINEQDDRYKKIKICSVLWQNILWNTAFEYNAEVFIKKFKEYWNAPLYTYTKVKKERRNKRWREFLIPYSAKVDDPEECYSYFFCTPWQKRTNPKTTSIGNRKTFQKFPDMFHNESAFKLFAAVILMRKMMESMQEFPIEYCRILLNMGDVFQCEDVRKELYGKKNAWKNPIKILGYFASQSIGMIGRGELNELVPGRMIELISKGRKKATKNPQLNMQYDFIGVQVCAHWAVESLRASVLKANEGIESPWFVGDESCAKRLCKWFFEDGINQEKYDYREPVVLFFQAFTDEYKRILDTLSVRQWMEKYDESLETITFCDVMFSRELTEDQWDEIGMLTRERFSKDVWLVVLTMRFQTGLRNRKIGEHEEWYKEWRDQLAAYVSDEDAEGVLFYYLCEVLKLDFPDDSTAGIYFETVKMVIGTIHGFTNDKTIFYQYYMILALKDAWKRYGTVTGKNIVWENIKELYAKRDSEKEKKLLEYFLVLLYSEEKNEAVNRVLGNIANMLKNYCEDECAPEKHYSFSKFSKPEEWNSLTDFGLQKNQGQWNVIRPMLDESHAFGKNTKNFFKVIDDSAGNWYVGIVTNDIKRENRNGHSIAEKEYYIGYGLKTKGFCKSNAFFNKGELVGIQMDLKGGIKRISKLSWKDDARPLNVEVIKISASILTLSLPNKEKFSIDDSRAKEKFHQILSLWQPDVSCLLREQGGDERTERIMREAVFLSEKGFYVPIERDFSRFIIECFYTQAEECEKALSMVFIREVVRNGKRGFLFSKELGVNYLLWEEDWDLDSLKKLDEKLEEENYLQGLIINIYGKVENDKIVLALKDEDAFDSRNWEWAKLFSEEDFFLAKRSEGTTKEEWYVDVNVKGMPERVKVEFGGFYKKIGKNAYNVQLGTDGWSLAQQRLGTVRVEQIQPRYINKSLYTLDGFNKLYHIKEGDILYLENNQIRKQRYGYYTLFTDCGLRVDCASESLSMESANNLAVEMISKRLCVVECVELKPINQEAEYEGIDIPALSQYESDLNGIVSLFSDKVNTSDVDVSKLELALWLKTGNEIKEIKVPVSAFASRPKSLGTPVTASRQKDGKWIFKSVFRKIQVRALWQIEDHRVDKRAEVQGIYVSRNMNVPGYGPCMVTQDRERPFLYVWNTDRVQKYEENSICGVRTGKGFVTNVRKRNYSWEVFPYAKHKNLVRLSLDGKEYYGDCRWGEFDDVEKGKNWAVYADVYLFTTEGNTKFYDMRRGFYSRSISLEKNKKEYLEKANALISETYQEWINGGDYHVIGTEVNENGKRKLRLHGLKVPCDIEKGTLRDRWTDKVSFVKEDRPWILGRYYSKNRVRALLLQKNGEWIASCHEATPFYVDDKLAGEFNIISGDKIHTNLYYAGLDEQNRLRFEWGYGYCLLVEEDDILDIDGNKINTILFYGDKIKYFSMIKGEGRHGWRIQIEYSAIERQVESRIWDDSFGENGGVIQLLEIRRDLELRKISIERVSVTETDFQSGTGWEFYKTSSAFLEEESIQTLLEEEGYEENTKLIFALLKDTGERNRVTSLIFTYLPLNGKNGGITFLEGKTVCMVAGEIKVAGSDNGVQKNKLNNDYMISLFLPNELPDEKENPQMQVNVLRRQFSVDESKLRILYRENKRKYYGCKMLVRLKKLNEANASMSVWDGNVISTPKRAVESLKKWVSNSQEECLVTLGNENKQIIAEVAPGILIRLANDVVGGNFSQGTLAYLWMEDENLKGKVILPGDGRYLSEKGRPAELLIMDGAAKAYRQLCSIERNSADLQSGEWEELNKRLDKNQFTVAGLPQILISDRALFEKKILEPIPRVEYLVKEEKNENTEIHRKDNWKFSSARLGLKDGEKPELRYFNQSEKIENVGWERISFWDGKISELVKRVKKGRWYYHDRKTAFYNETRNYLEAWPLPDGKKYDEIVLFPDKRGKLRYQREEFLKYGFPVRSIIENGFPEENGEYPIAGITENTVWIEVFPGKLIEIPVVYLFAGEKKVLLSGLWTDMLSPGDRLQLCQDEGFSGNQKKLILKDIKFGGRAGMGVKETFLPVKSIDGDGVVLGDDLWPVVLPIKVKEDLRDSELSCITADNGVFFMKEGKEIRSGNVLFVNFANKFMTAPGWNSVRIKPAHKELWKNAEWLCEDLLDSVNKKWMQKSSLMLPMTVNNVRVQKGMLEAWVYYQQPNMDELPCGTKVCCICVGVRNARNSLQEIVVRAGKAIFRIPAQNILPGIEGEKTSVVVNRLKEEKISFWIHKEEDGWHSGLQEVLEKDRVEVQMLFCIKAADGILCRTKDNLALRWLPASKASRAKFVSLEALWEGLSRRKNRFAKCLSSGFLSLTGTWQNEQKYAVLKTDGTRYRAIPVAMVETDETGRYCYLAELYPKGDLIYLYSEIEYDCKREIVLPIEISKKQADCVIAFSYGERRMFLHLTPWVYHAIGNISLEDDMGRFQELNPFRFKKEVPLCFERYRCMKNQAEKDADEGILNYELLRDSNRTSEQLVYLYSISSKKIHSELNFSELYEFIRLTLGAWLENEGKFLASGFKAEEKNCVKQMDVVTVISAILLLDVIEGKAGNDVLGNIAKPLSVHLTRMLGIGCGSSIYQEILLKEWLLSSKEKGGLWLRLNQLSMRGENNLGEENEAFSGQLSPQQIENLRITCKGLKMHTACNRELQVVVECILLSCGCWDDCGKFHVQILGKSHIMKALSIMGRILTPGAGSHTAKDKLEKSETRILINIWNQLLSENSLPLSLVTDTEIPVRETVRRFGIEYCEDFCKIVQRRGEDE